MPGRRKHPTDQGWAWVVLAASMGSQGLSGALVYSVGVLHTGLLHHFHSDSLTLVAVTGAVNTGLVCIAAPLAGFIINRFGCRTCCVLGGLLCFVGYTSSCFVTSVFLLFFTFGILAGVGLGLTYSATNITIGFYFDRLRGVASGISNSFQAVGILSGSVIFQALIEAYSIRGTFLLLGAASLHFCFFGMFFRPSIYEGSNMDIVVEDKPENQTLEDKPEKQTLEDKPENQTLEDKPGKQTLEDKPGKQTLEDKPEKQTLEDKPEKQTLEDKPEKQTLELQASPPDRPVDTLKLAYAEDKSHSLLEKSKEGRANLHDEVISGASRAANTTDDICADARNRDSATADTVNSNDVIFKEETHEDVDSTPQQFQTNINPDICKSVLVDETSTTATSTDRKELPNQDQTSHDNIAETPQFTPDEGSSPNSQEQLSHRLYTEDPGINRNSSVPATKQPYQNPVSDEGGVVTEADPESERLLHAAPDTAEDDQERRQWMVEDRQKARWGCCGSYMELLSDAAFMLHCAALFVSNVQVSGVFLHLPEYVLHHGTSPAKAAQLFLAVGCMSLVSKLSCGFAQADPDIDPLILSIGMMGLNGIFTILFPLYVDSYSQQVLFSVLFGLYFGGLYAISNPILVRFAGVSRLADAYGISMFILGMGYLMGPTLAATIVDGGGTYSHSFLFLGLMMLSGAFLDMAAACFLHSREKRGKSGQDADCSVEDEGVVTNCQSQAEATNQETNTCRLEEDLSDSITSQSQCLST